MDATCLEVLVGACTNLIAILVVVGIEAGLYIAQGQLAVGTCRDGQRNADVLAIGCCRTGISRNVLVVDIDATLDVPIVCG